MMTSTFRVTLLAALLLSVSIPVRAAEEEPGSTGAVAKWMSQEMDSVKSIGLPVCLYVYTNFKKTNPDAQFLEGKDFLDNADVQKALKGFHCIKMDVTRSTTIPKSWPKEMVEKFKAQKYAVVLMDASLQQQVIFKKKAVDAVEADPKAFVSVAEKIKAANEKRKVEEKKNEKKDDKENVADAAPKTVGKVPGLSDPNDKKDDGKGGAKKDPPKPAKPTGPADE